MSVNVQTAPRTLPLRLKRLELEDPLDTDSLKCKRPRLSLPPSPGLAPCLRPLTQSPTPGSAEQPCVSRIGPYILLEATEGAQTYRAVHSVTEAEFSCKVSAAGIPGCSFVFLLLLAVRIFYGKFDTSAQNATL